MEPNMHWQTLQSALDAAQAPELDAIETPDQLTLRQWLQSCIDHVRANGTLSIADQRRWNQVVPEQYRF